MAISQFLDIQIDIEPEVETIVDRSLDFGQIVSGSGYQEISLGSPGMGIFQVRALRTQRLLISLDSDDELSHSDPSISQTIPIELNASYTQNGLDDFRNSVPLSSVLENIVIEGPPQNPTATWSSIFLYISGGLNLGDVPAGTYTGQVTLTVIYE